MTKVDAFQGLAFAGDLSIIVAMKNRRKRKILTTGRIS